jgi:NTP pyrophosphatase (non-canonical NTP hydrolase)
MIRDMGITEQCERVHERMREKGFWDHETLGGPVAWRDGDPVAGTSPQVNPSLFPEKLMLIVTEVAEMMEAFRDSPEECSDEEEDEAADVLIRLMDYCGARGIDLGQAYLRKMAKNAGRPRLHGRQR